MQEEIEQLRQAIADCPLQSREDLERFKQLYTGRKGQIPALFQRFKALPKDQKAQLGKALNQLKQEAEQREAAAQQALKQARAEAAPQDLTLPGRRSFAGGRHPLAIVQRQIIRSLQRLGFSIAEGPEIEDDWHNFTALNFPPNHPARDMQDTFFVQRAPDYVLRTHTSSVQIRAMEQRRPPLRIIAPGRVYRNEAVSARAHCFFHQIEALYVDEGVSFADLKQTLEFFVTDLFGEGVTMRLRPSYFPFTEISAEVDISCLICGGEGCPVCKQTGWTEILGCGMVDPNVFEQCNIDTEQFTGFALGMGVERIAQLKYRVPDLRLYEQNDLRFLRQFQRVQ
jgi:phenylalanyl-tRNA synthetase alpha chain